MVTVLAVPSLYSVVGDFEGLSATKHPVC
ncbi:hypothetical protein RDI58_030732 [Solanum bulbocastanum]|uniref:Uncharacterized protein n=1 Tax=Solanum bulbocastanum TaxID=147425 RepID=A0AAN8SNJ6_SOLBU